MTDWITVTDELAQDFGIPGFCIPAISRFGVCCTWPGALAAATGTAKTPTAVECEASQSGPKGNAQPNPQPIKKEKGK